MSQCIRKHSWYHFVCFLVGQCLTANRNLHPCNWGADDEPAALGETQGYGPAEQQGAATHQVAEEPGEAKGLNQAPLAKKTQREIDVQVLGPV